MQCVAMHATSRCRDGEFHFWDAVDDFSEANMDLLFEGARMYLHNASGRFGAVPLSMTGAPLCQSRIVLSRSCTGWAGAVAWRIPSSR